MLRRTKNRIKRLLAPYKIRSYLKDRRFPEKKVVFGGHWSTHDGWLVLGREEQDVTTGLLFPDNSLDVVFTEHVVEHLPFCGALTFFKDARRTLRPGGTLRVVCPMFERLLSKQFSQDSELDRKYVATSMADGIYRTEHEALKNLGLDGVNEDIRTFFVNNLFVNHEHRFIWSAALMKRVIEQLGFHDVRMLEPGEGRNPGYCIERRARGIYQGRDWRADAALGIVYDPESLVIEANS